MTDKSVFYSPCFLVILAHVSAMSRSLHIFPSRKHFSHFINMFSVYLCKTHPNTNEKEIITVNASLLFKSAPVKHYRSWSRNRILKKKNRLSKQNSVIYYVRLSKCLIITLISLGNSFFLHFLLELTEWVKRRQKD